MNLNPITDRDCAWAASLLPRLPDGDLSLQEQAGVEAHFGRCARCREEAAAYSGVGAWLRDGAPSPGHLPSGAVMAARIQEMERRRPLFSSGFLLPRAAWGGLAAAALGILVLAFGLPRFSGFARDEEPRPTAAPTRAASPVLFLVDDETSGRRVVLSTRSLRP
jgi:anti-sigma factor RsiW